MTIVEGLIILPILLILVISAMPTREVRIVKLVGLYGSFIILFVSLVMWVKFDTFISGFQMMAERRILTGFNIYYCTGIDGISLWLIILTAIIIPLCILCSWTAVKYRVKELIILLLLTEFLLFQVFAVLDVLLFYIYFESILVPMFLIIGIWGSRERRVHAAYQFLLYTLIGSLFMLLAILLLYYQTGSTNIFVLINADLTVQRELIVWLAFFVAFAVKVPMVPVHIWLPEAHVEAPTAGSVILAGILLKMGTYAMLRFLVPVMPIGTEYYIPLVFAISIISIIYSSCTTIRQIDIKKIIAYSSVGHMNFVTLGLMSGNIQGIEGSVYLMLGHGVVSSALFLCIGMLYERYHTRIINYYGGLVQIMPIFAVIFFIFTLGNVSLPGTSNFVGEILVLVGVSCKSLYAVIGASIGIILGAVYAFWLFNRLVFGNVKINIIGGYSDLSRREVYICIPLLFLLIILGVYPYFILEGIQPAIYNILVKCI